LALGVRPYYKEGVLAIPRAVESCRCYDCKVNREPEPQNAEGNKKRLLERKIIHSNGETNKDSKLAKGYNLGNNCARKTNEKRTMKRSNQEL
jgi:hypothetical protein